MAPSNRRSRSFNLIKSALAAVGLLGMGSLSAPAALANASAPLTDGTYLYSQSVPSQPGDIYMVMEVAGSRTVGAFYMQSSSFDCFYGSISSNRLDLTVVDSYGQTAHPYALAMQSEPFLVAGQGAATAAAPVGFTAVGSLSNLDNSILETCQASYGE